MLDDYRASEDRRPDAILKSRTNVPDAVLLAIAKREVERQRNGRTSYAMSKAIYLSASQAKRLQAVLKSASIQPAGHDDFDLDALLEQRIEALERKDTR